MYIYPNPYMPFSQSVSFRFASLSSAYAVFDMLHRLCVPFHETQSYAVKRIEGLQDFRLLLLVQVGIVVYITKQIRPGLLRSRFKPKASHTNVNTKCSYPWSL